MKLKELAITASLSAALIWSAGWAQQSPGSQESQGTPPWTAGISAAQSTGERSTKGAKNAAKEKRWSGSLVDVGCMAAALGTVSGATQTQTTPAPGMPHFAASPQSGQGPGGGAPGGMPGESRGPQQPIPQQQTPSSGMSPEEQAKLAQASRVDSAAKQCAATPSTQTFGLATSDGAVMKFDPDGNAKAKEALRDASVQPGKKVKAKVTGTLESNETVKVASVEVKGKGKHASAGAAGRGM